MRGFVRRLFKYPVKLPNEAGSSRLKHIYRWLNGNHSFDEICSKTGECLVEFLVSTLFQRGDQLHTSKSDVYRRQILTSEVDPHTDRVKYL